MLPAWTSTPAQPAPTVTAPAAFDMHRAFASAFNLGTRESVSAFVRTHHLRGTGPSAENAINFWLALRLEVGPIQLVGVSRETRANRVADVFWYRGLTTGAYPGIVLTLDSADGMRVRAYGVNRAFRPAVAPRPPAVDERQIPAALDEFLRASADSGHFAGSVLVARRGRIVFEGAYGPADVSTGRRNQADTPFRLASVTKIFTGVAILQLAEQGRLSLDDPVSRFIPEYPAVVAERVTLRHLLTHTSGIELDHDSVFMARVSQARSVGELLALQVERLPHLSGNRFANFAPLTRYDYSNEGIDLLAAVVERVSGQSWSAYLAERVFRPAGMTASGADLLVPVAGLPVGYSAVTLEGARRAHRAPVPEVRGAVAALRPAGSGYASARDMVAFVRALTNGTLLRPETARLMMSPHVEVPAPPGASMPCTRAYGFTMVITRCAGGATSMGHTGGTLGQSAVVEHFPDSGYTVVVLSNYDRVTWWAELRVLELLGLR